MGLISIEGIRVYAFHGHLKEEAILGGHFIVSVWLEIDTSDVVKTDNLNDTVDYVKIIEIVEKKMSVRADMIEVPAQKIVDEILLLEKVKKVKVEIEKNEPPINSVFDKISVTIKGER